MAHGQLLVDFWDVGQGDCSVIHISNTEIILLDVGPIGSPVVDWLARHPNLQVNSIVLTHNDKDHVGALPSIIACCRKRIGIIYVMADRNVKTPQFISFYMAAERARQNGDIKNILRLESPTVIWSEKKSQLQLEVRHPTISANVLASASNETSAILVLAAPNSEAIIWAGDTTITNVAAVASNLNTAYMLGPHHGAPTDRQEKTFPGHLAAIGTRTIVASVGSFNGYKHPCVSYIKHARRSGARFCCTQLTQNCEKTSRLHHVCKGAALLGLPQAKSGFSCRGTIRLSFSQNTFSPDPFAENQHETGLKKLTRPKCLRYP